MPTPSTNFSFQLPTVGGDYNTWGGYLNANWTTLDTQLFRRAQTILASSMAGATALDRLNAAITAAADAVRGTLILAEADTTYDLGGTPLVLPSGCALDLNQATLTSTVAQSYLVQFTTDGDNFGLYNGALDGGGTTSVASVVSASVIFGEGCRNVFLDGLRIHNYSGNGMDFVSSSTRSTRNIYCTNHLQHTPAAGVIFPVLVRSGTDKARPQNVFLSNSQFYGSDPNNPSVGDYVQSNEFTADHITFQGVLNGAVHNVMVQHSGSAGMSLARGTEGIYVTNFLAFNCYEPGINLGSNYYRVYVDDITNFTTGDDTVDVQRSAASIFVGGAYCDCDAVIADSSGTGGWLVLTGVLGGIPAVGDDITQPSTGGAGTISVAASTSTIEDVGVAVVHGGGRLHVRDCGAIQCGLPQQAAGAISDIRSGSRVVFETAAPHGLTNYAQFVTAGISTPTELNGRWFHGIVDYNVAAITRGATTDVEFTIDHHMAIGDELYGSGIGGTVTLNEPTLDVTLVTIGANAQVTFDTAHNATVGSKILVQDTGVDEVDTVITVTSIISAVTVETAITSTGSYTSGGTGVPVHSVTAIVDDRTVTIDADTSADGAFTSGGKFTTPRVAQAWDEDGSYFTTTAYAGAGTLRPRATIGGFNAVHASGEASSVTRCTVSNPGSAENGYATGGQCTNALSISTSKVDWEDITFEGIRCTALSSLQGVVGPVRYIGSLSESPNYSDRAPRHQLVGGTVSSAGSLTDADDYGFPVTATMVAGETSKVRITFDNATPLDDSYIVFASVKATGDEGRYVDVTEKTRSGFSVTGRGVHEQGALIDITSIAGIADGNITSISKANPAVIGVDANARLVPGEAVTLNGLSAYWPGIDGATGYVRQDSTGLSIVLVGVDSSADGPAAWATATSYSPGDVRYDSAGTWWTCAVGHTSGGGTFSADRASNPTYWTESTTGTLGRADGTALLVTTASDHGLLDGDYARFTDITGADQLNDTTRFSNRVDATSFIICKDAALMPIDGDFVDAYGSGGTVRRVVKSTAQTAQVATSFDFAVFGR